MAFLVFPPVLCTVGLHQILVRVEEDAPVVIDAGHPDGQHGGLQPGAQVHIHRLFLCFHPAEESDVIPPSDANLSISKLNIVKFNVTLYKRESDLKIGGIILVG